jgi:hypothetical protein
MIQIKLAYLVGRDYNSSYEISSSSFFNMLATPKYFTEKIIQTHHIS